MLKSFTEVRCVLCLPFPLCVKLASNLLLFCWRALYDSCATRGAGEWRLRRVRGRLFINERISGVRTPHALRVAVSRPSSRSLALMENVTKQFEYAIKIQEHTYAKRMLRSCRLDEVASSVICLNWPKFYHSPGGLETLLRRHPGLHKSLHQTIRVRICTWSIRPLPLLKITQKQTHVVCE